MVPSDATVRVKSSLPEELIVELLLRLPVKYLARFRCVCKEWKSLTTNPSFISRHFRSGYASNSVIAWNDDNLRKLELMKSGCFRSGVYSFLPLDFKSLGYKKRPDYIVGQCDGIFCFYWEVDDRLTLCNPAIRESRDIQLIPYVPTSSESTRDTQWNLFFPTHNDSESDLDSISYSYPYSPNSDTEEWIPHIPNYSDSESDPDSYPYSYPYSSYFGSEILFGFGFDPNTNDYKVVELEEENYKPTNYAKIYSMKSGSWKRKTGDAALQDVVLSSGKQGNSLHSDGVIYWSVFKCAEGQDSDDSELDFDDEPTEAILSFDLRNEVFRLTAFPTKYYAFESISTTQQKKHSLSILHGKLAILCSFIEGSHTSFDVWAMDKDDVQDPWSHVLTVDPLPGFFRAMYFWRNSDLVIFEERGRYALTREWPYLYDREAKKMEPLEIYGELDFIYRESLVSVKVGNGG